MSGSRPRKAAPGQPPARPATPELDKMIAVSERSQEIGAFLEWLEARDVHLATMADCELVPYVHPGGVNALLAAYFQIDLAKVEAERHALLKHLREVQG